MTSSRPRRPADRNILSAEASASALQLFRFGAGARTLPSPAGFLCFAPSVLRRLQRSARLPRRLGGAGRGCRQPPRPTPQNLRKTEHRAGGKFTALAIRGPYSN